MFWDDNVDFRLGFAIGFESIKNHSEKLKIANWSAKFRFWVDDYIRFRNVHANTIDSVDFWTQERQGPIQSIKTVVRRTHMYAKPQREHDFEPETL